MYCISVTHRNTSAEERQRFSFTASEQGSFLQDLKNKGLISGGVIVSTCNRSEIYVNLLVKNPEGIERQLSAFKQMELSYIRSVCFYYEGKKAIRHLMKVAAGLDSLLLGEDEILHQLKEAYKNASEAGLVDAGLHMAFQGAFGSAKAIKTDTDLSKTAVSYGTLSALEIQKFLGSNMETVQDQEKRFVLVIGATGKMGSILVKDLLDKGISVVGTSRTHGCYTYELKEEHREKAKLVPFSDRYAYVREAAAIVCCTASPHYVLSGKKYREAAGGEPKLLIDLAVPYDIDREISYLDGVTLLDIDYFKEVAKGQEAHKLSEKEKAMSILEECLEELMKKLYLQEYLPKIHEKMGTQWDEKTLYAIKDSVDSDAFLKVLLTLAEQEDL